MNEIPEVDEIIDRAIAGQRIVGAVVLVAQHGRLVHECVAGLSDRETGTPMSRSDTFRFASITKPITAVTAMSLVETGDLDLTSPITRWLPDFRPATASGERPAITIDHLLLHTSGLAYRMNEPTDSDYSVLGVSDGLDLSDLTLSENIDRIGRTRLRFAPGSDWLYSVSYDVLGGIIEAATGASLPQVVEDRVTGPLGMAHTTFAVGPETRVATAYVSDAEGIRPICDDEPLTTVAGFDSWMAPSRIFDAGQSPSGGAGMAGTPDDVLTFLEALRAGGDGVLEPDTFAGMCVPRAPHEGADGVQEAHGRGWAIVQPGEDELLGLPVGSLSWGSAYGHSWSVDPRSGTTCLYFTNTRAPGDTGAFLVDLNRAVHGRC